MAKDAENLHVALDMNIFVAAVGATEPDSTWDFTTDSLEDLGWTEMGWNTKDGVTATYGRTTVDITGQGSLTALRTLVTDAPISIGFTLEELTATTYDFATGGATSTALGSNYQIDLNPPSVLAERALAFLSTDGSEYVLVVARRGIVSGDTAIPFVDNNATLMPITFSVLTPGDQSSAVTLISNVAELAPVGS